TEMMAYMLPIMMPLRISWARTSIVRSSKARGVLSARTAARCDPWAGSGGGADNPRLRRSRGEARLVGADPELELGDRGFRRIHRHQFAALPLHQEWRDAGVLTVLAELGAPAGRGGAGRHVDLHHRLADRSARQVLGRRHGIEHHLGAHVVGK